MAGGHMKYRTLGRGSAHRQALLRNLVTSLVKQEAIHTTWPKAKEAQRLADKLITLAKRNNETARRQAQGILFTPHQLLPKLFGELRERYLTRPGGYTRVLRTEPKDKDDQAPSAILELVDGQRDMRFAMTAATVARDEALRRESTPITLMNVKKLTAFRRDGEAEFRALVDDIKRRERSTFQASVNREKRRDEGGYKFQIGGSTTTASGPWNGRQRNRERAAEAS